MRPVSQRSPLRAIGRLSPFAIFEFATAYLAVILAEIESSDALNSTPRKPRIAAPHTFNACEKTSDQVVDLVGMQWLPAGKFQMRSDEADFAAVEQLRHRVRVDGFWIDETEVTNSPFSELATASVYVTTAERTIDWETLRQQLPPGTPKSPDENLQRVTKGESFLGSEGYCWNYRPSARRGNATGTEMSHAGFRCVRTPDRQTRRKPQERS